MACSVVWLGVGPAAVHFLLRVHAGTHAGCSSKIRSEPAAAVPEPEPKRLAHLPGATQQLMLATSLPLTSRHIKQTSRT